MPLNKLIRHVNIMACLFGKIIWSVDKMANRQNSMANRQNNTDLNKLILHMNIIARPIDKIIWPIDKTV